MEDSEEELLKELARRSRDLDSLSKRLSASTGSEGAAASLLEIGGLTVSASDVLGMERAEGEGEGCVLTVHLSGIDPRRLEYPTKAARSQACNRLLKLCGASSLESPLSGDSRGRRSEEEGEAWIELGGLIVRKDCVLGCERRSERYDPGRLDGDGETRVVRDLREKGPEHWLTVHLSGMEAWNRRFGSAKPQEAAFRLLCGCVWGSVAQIEKIT